MPQTLGLHLMYNFDVMNQVLQYTAVQHVQQRITE